MAIFNGFVRYRGFFSLVLLHFTFFSPFLVSLHSNFKRYFSFTGLNFVCFLLILLQFHWIFADISGRILVFAVWNRVRGHPHVRALWFFVGFRGCYWVFSVGCRFSSVWLGFFAGFHWVLPRFFLFFLLASRKTARRAVFYGLRCFEPGPLVASVGRSAVRKPPRKKNCCDAPLSSMDRSVRDRHRARPTGSPRRRLPGHNSAACPPDLANFIAASHLCNPFQRLPRFLHLFFMCSTNEQGKTNMVPKKGGVPSPPPKKKIH